MSAPLVDLVNRTVLCLAIAGAVTSVTSTIGTPATPAPPALATIEFGILDTDGSFVQSDVVPLLIGQEFGWRLHVADNDTHTWREVLIAPAAPREWIGDDLVVEGEGTMGITERTESARGGVLTHGWTITEGDPAGPYQMQLFLDGELVETTTFVLR
ncbi:MAG: hypothetical protein IT383_03035 [Deltaproteobacteria bacterium]|nr:hypothetical protein [Deltaproteobacteria bacterium]